MYKKLILMTLFLTSCSSIKESSNGISHDYSEVNDRRILWTEIFFQSENSYGVYVFSSGCVHCEEIKNEIIEYALSNVFPLYFVSYQKEIKTDNNITETIGASDYANVWIKGTPTLIIIENKIVTNNIAGSEKISDYIRH